MAGYFNSREVVISSRGVTTRNMTDEGRALLTEREREIIAGEADVSDNYRYKVESVVRNRVRNKMGEDVAALREHLPEVYENLQDEVRSDEP